MEIYINIALGVLAIGVTFFSYYLAIRNKIEQAAKDAINIAEDLDKIGAEKMQIAVEQVYAVIPAIVKPVFPKDFIEQIIQEVFDKMTEFAEKQVAKEQKKNAD
jgi:hypothetical protein